MLLQEGINTLAVWHAGVAPLACTAAAANTIVTSCQCILPLCQSLFAIPTDSDCPVCPQQGYLMHNCMNASPARCSTEGTLPDASTACMHQACGLASGQQEKWRARCTASKTVFMVLRPAARAPARNAQRGPLRLSLQHSNSIRGHEVVSQNQSRRPPVHYTDSELGANRVSGYPGHLQSTCQTVDRFIVCLCARTYTGNLKCLCNLRR